MPLHEQVFGWAWLLTCGYAMARGGAPERIVACGFVIAFLLTLLLEPPRATGFHAVEWRLLLVDGALLAAIAAVALRSTRYWLPPMASMQLVDILGHVSRTLDPAIVPRAYYALTAFVSFPMLALLAAGVWWHRRRLRRFGIDYAWVAELPPRYRAGWHVDERARPAA